MSADGSKLEDMDLGELLIKGTKQTARREVHRGSLESCGGGLFKTAMAWVTLWHVFSPAWWVYLLVALGALGLCKAGAWWAKTCWGPPEEP